MGELFFFLSRKKEGGIFGSFIKNKIHNFLISSTVKPIILLIVSISIFSFFIDFAIKICSAILPSFLPFYSFVKTVFFLPLLLNYLDKLNKPLSCHIRLINFNCQ